MNSEDYLAHLNNNIHAVALRLTNDGPYTSVFTQRLTYALGKSIHKAGGIPEPEKELPIQRIVHRKNGTTDFKAGHLDLFGLFPHLTSIAIELDRTNKLWSLDKLLCAHKEFGSLGVWIRWKGEVTVDVPSNISLIDLSYLAHRITTQPKNYSGTAIPFDFL